MNSFKTIFAGNLNLALDECRDKVPRKGKGRQNVVGRMFKVDQKAARKWLEGEGFPTLEKSIEIAMRLNVAVEWLLTGRGEKRVMEQTNIQLAELINAFWLLPDLQRSEMVNYANYLVKKNTSERSMGVSIEQPYKQH